MRHIISLLMENEAGALSRVSGLFLEVTILNLYQLPLLKTFHFQG